MKRKRKRKQPLLKADHNKAHMKFVDKYEQWRDPESFSPMGPKSTGYVQMTNKESGWMTAGSKTRALWKEHLKFAEEVPWYGGAYLGTGRLVKIDGKLTFEQYIRILEDALEGFIEDWGMDKKDFILQQKASQLTSIH
ncbi:hypothetical protein BGZ65_006428 [Modicella reniformis]|uniref:Uncharacterized protein n=1 Tax=Modicella reniformis TaxID=1440133 RepID=A0A9P6M7W8_9FUNG|nr:hypothetical protein BGZ65_006428 [Modicella reniformis]